MNVEYRLVSLEDIMYLSENIRINDASEVNAVFDSSIYDAIKLSVDKSALSASVFVGGELNAILGVCPVSNMILNTSGSPWMLGTDAVYRNKRVLCQEYGRIIGQMLNEFSFLVNYVDSRNKPAVRFLKKAGFTLEDAKPFGLHGVPFHRFTMRA